MEVVVNQNFESQIEKLEKLAEYLDRIEKQTQKLQFITIKEFAQVSGWTEATVQKIFNRPDFPSCDFGKTKVAEINAVREYFRVPRRK